MWNDAAEFGARSSADDTTELRDRYTLRPLSEFNYAASLPRKHALATERMPLSVLHSVRKPAGSVVPCRASALSLSLGLYAS